MRYNQAQALFRLEETGQSLSGYTGPSSKALVTQLGIDRPAIWSIPA